MRGCLHSLCFGASFPRWLHPLVTTAPPGQPLLHSSSSHLAEKTLFPLLAHQLVRKTHPWVPQCPCGLP